MHLLNGSMYLQPCRCLSIYVFIGLPSDSQHGRDHSPGGEPPPDHGWGSWGALHTGSKTLCHVTALSTTQVFWSLLPCSWRVGTTATWIQLPTMQVKELLISGTGFGNAAFLSRIYSKIRTCLHLRKFYKKLFLSYLLVFSLAATKNHHLTAQWMALNAVKLSGCSSKRGLGMSCVRGSAPTGNQLWWLSTWRERPHLHSTVSPRWTSLTQSRPCSRVCSLTS